MYKCQLCDLNLVITVPADVLAPNGARPSAWTAMTTNLVMIMLAVWYKTKFGNQNLATKFGNHLCMATKFGSQS